MTCHEVDRFFSSCSGREAVPPKVAEHVAGCERCRGLASVLDAQGPAPLPSPHQLTHIKSMLLGDLRPVRPLASFPILLSVFALIFLAVIAAGTVAIGPNGWKALGVTQRFLAFTPIVIASGLLAFSAARQMAPGSSYTVSSALWSTGVLATLVAGIFAVFERRDETAFVANGLNCFKAGIAFAAVTGLLFACVLRRGAILSPRLTGATAGGLAGLAGLAVLEVHCPNLNRDHILVWHLAVAGLGALGGLSLGAAAEHRRRGRDFPVA